MQSKQNRYVLYDDQILVDVLEVWRNDEPFPTGQALFDKLVEAHCSPGALSDLKETLQVRYARLGLSIL